MSKRTALFILLCIVIIGTGLRSWHLTSRSLWFDEAFSWRLVQFPFQEMILRDAQDVHPPLYYIVLRVWTVVFGTSLLALRSFSVFFAAATIAGGYLFVSSAFRSRTTGLWAVLLLAVSGWQIQFAWEARMYTLGTFLALLCSWLLIRAVRSGRWKLAPWLLYGLFASAFAYIHYFAFFTLAAHALFVVGVVITKTKWRIGEIVQSSMTWYALLAGILAVALYAPWMPTFLKQNAQVQQQYWIPAIGGWSIPDTFLRMIAPTSGIPSHTGFGVIVTLIPILMTLLCWYLLVMVRKREESWLVVMCGAVPFILSILISFISQSVYQDRFLVFSHIFIVIGFAALIGTIPFTVVRRIGNVVAAAVLILTSILFWIELDIPHKPGARVAASYIADHVQSGDQVVVSSPFVYFAILHYAQEEHGRTYDPKLFSQTGELIHFAGSPILVKEDFVGPEIFSLKVRVMWAVDTTGFGGSKLEVPGGWIEQEHRSFEEVFAHQGSVSVTKYIRQ